MPTKPPRRRDLADALAVCGRIQDELHNLQQTLGLGRGEANDAGLSGAAGELQVIQANVENLAAILEEMQRDGS